jgi:HemY protein
MSRAVHAAGDPVWTADGVVSDRWLPVTPTGRLDGFEWRVPLAELGVTRPVIEIAPPEPAEPPPPVVETAAAPPAPEPVAARPPARERAKAKPVEPVIPLVHAPDDPGTEAGPDVEPVPEAASPPASATWQRIKAMFR